MNDVYITRITKFLPNSPVTNDEMEHLLGFINNKASRAKRIILRNNGIKTRYYAIDKNGNYTHNNAQLTEEAIKKLFDKAFTVDDIELLSCGTSSPDQLLPAHSSMVHGYLGGKNFEVNTASGVCCSGMSAMKYGYMAVKSGDKNNAICSGSEKASSWLHSDKFSAEFDNPQDIENLENQPIIAFNKDFLRWMLSDGAGAVLLENKPVGDHPLKIEWIDGYSYANELESCMYAGGDKQEDGHIKPWRQYSQEDWLKKSIFSIKQDVKLLDENILKKGNECFKIILEKYQLDHNDIDYFLPHISSMYFKEKLHNLMKENDVEIPWEKWLINLPNVGNVGSASIYLMLEELVASGKLKKGQKIFLSVPESGRFTYMYALLTVC